MSIFKWHHKTEINFNFKHWFLASYATLFNDQHDQWNVLNLLTYKFGINDTFEQDGTVPLTRDLLGGGSVKRPHLYRRVITPVWRGAAAPNFGHLLQIECTYHLLIKFKKYRTEIFGAINVLVTPLHTISNPKVANVCESIKGKLLNGNAYKTPVRRKMTSSTWWLSLILDIFRFWLKKIRHISLFLNEIK